MKRAGLMLLLGLVCGTAWAEDAPHLRITRLHIDYAVNTQGGYTEEMELIEQLGTEQAVHQAGTMKVPYSSSLDEFKVLSARTIKKDGRAIEVPAKSIFVQDGLIGESTGSFQDVKTTVVVFPELEPGDSIALKTQRTQRRPMYPGHFSYATSFSREFLYDDVSIRISVPKDMALQVRNNGLAAVEPVTAGERRLWRWSFVNAQRERVQESVADPLIYGTSLMVSSWPGYEALGNSVAQNFADKAEVSPAIRAKAAEITAGVQDPVEQTRRILRWVAKNVRYFAVVLELGGIVPRSADEVLSSRYGDCKDHVVLLQAMLAARGIRSVPALINTGEMYELPPVPVSSSFNHVILYVPDQNMYLESTTPYTLYGMLPFSDDGRPVILLQPGHSTLARTPVSAAKDDVTRVKTTLRIAADGSASGEDVRTGTGGSMLGFADWADSFASEDPVTVARHLLLQNNLTGEGTYSVQRLDTGKDFAFTLQYELPNFAGYGALRVVPPLDPFEASARQEVSDKSVRRLPFSCGSQTTTHDIELAFPPGASFEVPRGESVSGSGRRYTSTYRRDGASLRIRREYVSEQPKNSCPPSHQEDLRKIHERILGDLNFPLRYTLPAQGRR